MQEDGGYGRIARQSRAESTEEMHHADTGIARILFPEGQPNLQRLDPIRTGQTLRESLECDLAAEHDARTLSLEARNDCDQAGDHVTRELFKELLEDEEGPIDVIETPLDLRDKIGAERYGLLNALPADEA